MTLYPACGSRQFFQTACTIWTCVRLLCVQRRPLVSSECRCSCVLFFFFSRCYFSLVQAVCLHLFLRRCFGGDVLLVSQCRVSGCLVHCFPATVCARTSMCLSCSVPPSLLVPSVFAFCCTPPLALCGWRQSDARGWAIFSFEAGVWAPYRFPVSLLGLGSVLPPLPALPGFPHLFRLYPPLWVGFP